MVLLNRTILQGDVLEKIKEIPGKSIDVVISSPPYWGLRDYSVEGQLGLEPDFNDYLNTMQKIMDEIKHVLKDTGTCWINLGDTYSGSGKGAGTKNCKESWRPNKKPELNETITAKSRVGIPERFYINCIDNGWIARNHIVWTKNNSMPSSVKDRFSNKWESVFFFAKQQKYYFDLDAVREKSQTDTKPFNVRVRDSDTKRFLQGATNNEKQKHNRRGEDVVKNRRLNYNETRQQARKLIGSHDNPLGNPKGKNPGDIFQINTKPFKEAHFATFPPALPEKILKCACPKDGIVLDPFFGSGTVGLVAEQLGLNWIGIELNKEYIEIANKRLEKYRNHRLEVFT